MEHIHTSSMQQTRTAAQVGTLATTSMCTIYPHIRMALPICTLLLKHHSPTCKLPVTPLMSALPSPLSLLR